MKPAFIDADFAVDCVLDWRTGGGKLFVTLIDCRDGSEVWSHQTTGKQPTTASPAIDPNRQFVYSYGTDGNALRGKDLWLAVTTGGPQDSYQPGSYNRYVFDAFLPPYEQTAALCGMRFAPPLVLHGAHTASEAAVAAHVDQFVQRLQSYPDWPELNHLPDCATCEVPPDARPE